MHPSTRTQRLDCRNAKLYCCNTKLSTAIIRNCIGWTVTFHHKWHLQIVLWNVQNYLCVALKAVQRHTKTYIQSLVKISVLRYMIQSFAYQQHWIFKPFFSHRQPFKCASDALSYFRPNCVLSIYRFVTVFPLQFCFARPALPYLYSSSCLCGSFVNSQGLYTPSK